MAKPTWVTLENPTGCADGSFKIKAAQYTGRKKRSDNGTNGVVTVASREIPSVQTTVAVDQNGKFRLLVDPDEYNIGALGGDVIVLGSSNAESLKFEIHDELTDTWSTVSGRSKYEDGSLVYNGQASPMITMSTTYTAADKTTNNDASIEGDPGASAVYSWNFIATVGPNNATQNAVATIRISSNEDLETAQYATIHIGTGTGYIELYHNYDPETGYSDPYISHTFDADGETSTVYVHSNEEWVAE